MRGGRRGRSDAGRRIGHEPLRVQQTQRQANPVATGRHGLLLLLLLLCCGRLTNSSTGIVRLAAAKGFDALLNVRHSDSVVGNRNAQNGATITLAVFLVVRSFATTHMAAAVVLRGRCFPFTRSISGSSGRRWRKWFNDDPHAPVVARGRNSVRGWLGLAAPSSSSSRWSPSSALVSVLLRHATRIDRIVDEFLDDLSKGVAVRDAVVIVIGIGIVAGASRVVQVVAHFGARGFAAKAAQAGIGSKGSERHGRRSFVLCGGGFRLVLVCGGWGLGLWQAIIDRQSVPNPHE